MKDGTASVAMKLVIFDCDGTIVDSQHMIVEAMARAFDAHQLDAPDRSAVLGVVGLSLDTAISRLLPDDERSIDVSSLSDAYRSAFRVLRREQSHHEPLYEGARAVISSLAECDDVLLGVATGKSQRGVEALFERESLGQHFFTVQTADDHPSKPHPAMLHEAMVHAGAEAANTVMIGDTTFDMEMALAAGVGAIGVTWGYHDADALKRAGAHELIDAYPDLTEGIDRVLTRRRVAV